MNDDIDRCPGTNREGEPCGHPVGWGTDRDGGPCKFHGGAADNRGAKNGNYKTGAYSEFEDFVFDNLSDGERQAVEAVDFEEDGQKFAKDVVREAYAKYVGTGDDRFLREARQWAKDFGVIESPADQLEVTGEGGGPLDVVINEEVVETEFEDES